MHTVEFFIFDYIWLSYLRSFTSSPGRAFHYGVPTELRWPKNNQGLRSKCHSHPSLLLTGQLVCRLVPSILAALCMPIFRVYPILGKGSLFVETLYKSTSVHGQSLAQEDILDQNPPRIVGVIKPLLGSWDKSNTLTLEEFSSL